MHTNVALCRLRLVPRLPEFITSSDQLLSEIRDLTCITCPLVVRQLIYVPVHHIHCRVHEHVVAWMWRHAQTILVESDSVECDSEERWSAVLEHSLWIILR